MTRSRADGAHDYVPLSERLVALQAVRALLVVVVVVHAVASGGSHAGALLGACASYGLVSVVLELARRVVARNVLPIVGMMLTFDVLFLGAVMVASGGPQSRLMFAVYLHLVAVTLLLSFRSGLKVAVGHSTAIFVSYYVRTAGLLSTPWLLPSESVPRDLQRAAVEGAAGFWLVALVTAGLSALSERELRRSKVQLRALADMGVQMEAAAGTGALLERLCLGVRQGFGDRRVAALAVREGKGWLAVAEAGEPVVTSAGASPGEAVARAWHERRTQLMHLLNGEDESALGRALPGAHNVAIVPLIAESQNIGALAVEFGGGKRTRIRSRQIEMLERFAAHTALEIRSAWLLEEVQRLATTDALTGLPNRRSLQDTLVREVAQAGRAGRPLGVVLLDLDHFKQINDTHGHQTGDAVLKSVGDALRSVLRTGDLAARYGGEEFCVVLPDTDGAGSLAAAARIRAAIANSDSPVSVTASAGSAAMPSNAATVDGLLAAADEALYEAKDQGRDRAVRSRRRRRTSATLVG